MHEQHIGWDYDVSLDDDGRDQVKAKAGLSSGTHKVGVSNVTKNADSSASGSTNVGSGATAIETSGVGLYSIGASS